VAVNGWRASKCLPSWYVCISITDPKFTTDYAIDTPQESDILIERQHGQDVIDSLSVLEDVIPTFHEQLWPKLYEIFPLIDLALQSRFAIVRQAAARCFATICDLMTAEAMRYMIEKILPLIHDPLVLTNRQGTTELIYRELLFDISSDLLFTFIHILRHCESP